MNSHTKLSALCLLLLSYVLHDKQTLAFNKNLSYKRLTECKEYQIEGQYLYRDSFTISDLKNNKPYDNEIFRLKFYVLTRNDAHIMITNEPGAQGGDSVYEMVLGGWSNTKSAIRVKKERETNVEKKGEVVSPLYPTEIIVALRDDGELSVILPDFERPYMVYKDKTARFWTYISFASWGDQPARWFYDCPLGNDGPSDND